MSDLGAKKQAEKVWRKAAAAAAAARAEAARAEAEASAAWEAWVAAAQR